MSDFITENDLYFWVRHNQVTFNVYYDSVVSNETRRRPATFLKKDNVAFLAFALLDRFHEKLSESRFHTNIYSDADFMVTHDIQFRSFSTPPIIHVSFSKTDLFNTSLDQLQQIIMKNQPFDVHIVPVSSIQQKKEILRSWENIQNHSPSFSSPWLSNMLSFNSKMMVRKDGHVGGVEEGGKSKNQPQPSMNIDSNNGVEDEQEEVKRRSNISSSPSPLSTSKNKRPDSLSSSLSSPVYMSDAPSSSNASIGVDEEEESAHQRQRLESMSPVLQRLLPALSILPPSQEPRRNTFLKAILGSGEASKGIINMFLPYLNNKDSTRLITSSKLINNDIISVNKRSTLLGGDTDQYIHISHWVQIAIACPGMLHLFKKVWYENKQFIEDGVIGLGDVRLFVDKLFPLFAQHVEYLYLPLLEYVQEDKTLFSLTRLIAQSRTKIKHISFHSFVSPIGTDRMKVLKWENENQSGIHRIVYTRVNFDSSIYPLFYNTFVDFPIPLRSVSIVVALENMGGEDEKKILFMSGLKTFLYSYLNSPFCRSLNIKFGWHSNDNYFMTDRKLRRRIKTDFDTICQSIHSSPTLSDLYFHFEDYNPYYYNAFEETDENKESDDDPEPEDPSKILQNLLDFLYTSTGVALNNEHLTYLQAVVPSPVSLLPLLKNKNSMLIELHLTLNNKEMEGIELKPDDKGYASTELLLKVFQAISSHPRLRVLDVDFPEFESLYFKNHLSSSPSFFEITKLKTKYYNKPFSYKDSTLISTIEDTWVIFFNRFSMLTYLEIDFKHITQDEIKKSVVPFLQKIMVHTKVKTIVLHLPEVEYNNIQIGFVEKIHRPHDVLFITKIYIAIRYRNMKYETRFMQDFVRRRPTANFAVDVPYQNKTAIQMFIKAGSETLFNFTEILEKESLRLVFRS